MDKRLHPDRTRGLLPFFSVLIMIGAVVSLAAAGLLPASFAPDFPTTSAEKSRLLNRLPVVDGVGYEPDSLVLFSGSTPVMIIWTEADPIELWSPTGQFVAPLTYSEYRRVVAVASETIGNCEDKKPSLFDLGHSPSHATA